MEVAVIDWQNINSIFVRDDLLEEFNAPQWVDLSAPVGGSEDDEDWFCRPDCNHPKTVEEFYRAAATPTSKHQRSASVSEVPKIRDRIRRLFEDNENQNPNLGTPQRLKTKAMKEMIQSNTEKKTNDESLLQKEQTRKLRSTHSARNLFSGVDLMSKVTEFCKDLKKLTARAKEKERAIEDDDENIETTPPPIVDKQKKVKDLGEKENERINKNILKEKIKKQRNENENGENTPIAIDVKKAKQIADVSLSKIRTYPPTPQGFSASCGETTKANPPKAFSSRPPVRGVLKELVKDEEEPARKINRGERQVSAVTETEARGLDVFWFLKPCTLSTT